MTYDLKKLLLLSLKIAVGSSFAIWIAESAGLRYGASAGSITLLTLLTTKLETFRLSLYRLLTFIASVFLAFLAFTFIRHDWTAYGAFIFIVVLLSHLFGVKATVSVNAVIGTHFLAEKSFEPAFIWNEFLLVIIGIAIAVIMNLFHDYRGDRSQIRKNMRYTEERLRDILDAASLYLSEENAHSNVWENMRSLEGELKQFVSNAYEYQDNTFSKCPQYYIDYFNMRLRQCRILHSLHSEMKKIRSSMPAQAAALAEYIIYLKDYVVEINYPDEQIRRLHEIIDRVNDDPLPETAQEFTARAVLYHIMMDIEEFLKAKRNFVDNMDENQVRKYWKADHKDIRP